ncbi:unnamed protein product [Ectocarpus sp. CCAP 1310/34]|nr:unnamed protein product [Ectocarpus sp. CCAP 1310/34]
MSWCLLIVLLLGAPFLPPCGGSLHVFYSGATPTGSAEGATAGLLGASDRSMEGGAEALRRFASTRAMKTGTTIAGVVFEGGVVLGADTRATGGKTVCDRNCDKIHILASNIACCGAGTSADAVRITEGARLALLRMAREMQACLPSSRSPLLQSQSRADGERPLASCDSGLDEVQRKHLRVGAAALLLERHLFRYQGTVSAALVLGGVDVIGEHIYQAPLIHEGGSLAEVEFTAMGSGSLAALSVLERGYRENMTEQEAKELVLEGIAAGIDNDLGSGSNIDLCVITAERGLEHHRGAWTDPGLDDDGIAARELPEGIESWQPNQLDASDDTESGGFDVIVGGEGGSGAWVGNVRRRNREKSVMKVDHDDDGALRRYRCSALDDKIEVL